MPDRLALRASSWISTVRHRATEILSSLGPTPHDTAILSMAVPAVMALAVDPLLAMVDTGIVGQLGQDELASLGVNNSIFGFAFVVFVSLSGNRGPLRRIRGQRKSAMTIRRVQQAFSTPSPLPRISSPLPRPRWWPQPSGRRTAPRPARPSLRRSSCRCF